MFGDKVTIAPAGPAYGRVLLALNKTRRNADQTEQALRARVQQELNKVLLIKHRHAIIHPWAMMIHFHNASIAATAVVHAIRFVMLTVLAPLG